MAESQLDMTDPTTAAIYRHMEAQQRYLDSMSQRLQVHDSYLTQQQQEASNAYMARAREQFQSSYSVTPEQVSYLERVAANLGVLPSLLSGVDPTTGQYSPPDPISALNRAMEIAYWTVPEYREVELQRQASQSYEDRQRKSKLGGLSGSSGSVPRNPPQPTNPQERREAMMTEVGQMMQGSWAGGN